MMTPRQRTLAVMYKALKLDIENVLQLPPEAEDKVNKITSHQNEMAAIATEYEEIQASLEQREVNVPPPPPPDPDDDELE